MARSYNLKIRNERQNRTRQKIIEAAVELHQNKGIGATTMGDIAKLANVGRVTVYRHFPDGETLARACSGLYFDRNPLPDPHTWRSVQDGRQRLHLGLSQTYSYHNTTRLMMEQVSAEARDHAVMVPYNLHWQRAADILLEAWPETHKNRELLRAAFLLAIDFETWRTLVVTQGLSDDQAIELMVRLTCDCPSAGHT